MALETLEDYMKCKKIFWFELIGVIVIFLIGSLWHNLYELSGENLLMGLISPVNESIWEHWKLGFYPILIYALFEYSFIKDEANNFLFSKVIGIIVFNIVCFGLLYIYKNLIGEPGLPVHLTAYFLGILAAQIVSYLIMCYSKENNDYLRFALVFIGVFIMIFIKFTFNPPLMDYFKDSETGTFGINKIIALSFL